MQQQLPASYSMQQLLPGSYIMQQLLPTSYSMQQQLPASYSMQQQLTPGPASTLLGGGAFGHVLPSDTLSSSPKPSKLLLPFEVELLPSDVHTCNPLWLTAL